MAAPIHSVTLLHRRAQLIAAKGAGHLGSVEAAEAGATLCAVSAEQIVTRDSTGLRLMAVHAHPDDEASKGAATTARYRAEGAEVMVVTCTGGERGDVLNDEAAADVERLGLAEVRRAEMARSAAILDVHHAWLGFADSGFPQPDENGELPALPPDCFAVVPIAESAPRLVAHLREFRPQVVTTYDERGGYPHPDHIRCHEVTMAAVAMAGDPHAHPELGPPWQVSKVYFNQQFSRARVEALHLALIDADLESPYHDWLDRWDRDPSGQRPITTRVPAASWFSVRDAALLAHRTQIGPDSSWFAVPPAMHVSVWPTEDFELARSVVPVTLPEDDLFAGLR